MTVGVLDCPKQNFYIRTSACLISFMTALACTYHFSLIVQAFSRQVASCTFIPTGELVNDWTVLHELTDVLGGCKVSPEIARKSLALFNQLIGVCVCACVIKVT